jgi:hypothetical protein
MKTIFFLFIITISLSCIAVENNYWKECIIRVEPNVYSQHNKNVHYPKPIYLLDSNKCIDLRIELRKSSWYFKYRNPEPLSDSIIFTRNIKEKCKTCNKFGHNDDWPKINSQTVVLSDTSIAEIISNQKILFKFKDNDSSDCIRDFKIKFIKNGKVAIKITSDNFNTIIPVYLSEDTITILENEISYYKKRISKRLNFWKYYILPNINPFNLYNCNSNY